jgi:hypothetical protein
LLVQIRKATLYATLLPHPSPLHGQVDGNVRFEEKCCSIPTTDAGASRPLSGAPDARLGLRAQYLSSQSEDEG